MEDPTVFIKSSHGLQKGTIWTPGECLLTNNSDYKRKYDIVAIP